jgi:hypothetical protein
LDEALEDLSAAGSDFGAVFGPVFLVAIAVKLSRHRHDDA